jgi:hypothetical protein
MAAQKKHIHGQPISSTALMMPEHNRNPFSLMRTHPDAVNAHRSLSTEFVADVHACWKVHGKQVLETLAKEYPQVFGPMVAKMVHVQKVELGGPGDFHVAMSRAELLDKVGERFGQQGRAMFERFVAQLDRLGEQQERQTRG